MYGGETNSHGTVFSFHPEASKDLIQVISLGPLLLVYFFFLIEDEFFPSLVVLSSPRIHSSRLELTHSVVGVSVFARHWIGPSAPGLRCPCPWNDTQEQPLHRGARRSTQSLVVTGGG